MYIENISFIKFLNLNKSRILFKIKHNFFFFNPISFLIVF